MPLSALVRQLQQVALSGEVLQRCNRDERLRLSGAGRGARALISSVLAGCAEAPLLVVVPTLEEAGRWAALLELMGWSSAQLYPTSEGSPYEPFDPTSEITWGQLQVLSELLDAKGRCAIVATERISLQGSYLLGARTAEHELKRYDRPRSFVINYGLDEQKAATQRFIRRWRLEPSDPAAYARGELVEPVEPITYYLDPATPPRWREFVRQGVEDWNVAFEAAGFLNAIRALDPPSPEEDSDWDPEDVRYSTVRWTASTTRNAVGPSVSDPRTGEIIESDIVWYHNHMRSYRNRLMLETGAANPLARSLNQADELMGEAMRQVIAHEIGHAIGLPHNMIASSAFPVDSLRNADFARRMGVAPSVMDYARQNYIAQPGDGLVSGDFIRQIGPYDLYSVEWGYRRLDAGTPEAERTTLRGLIDRARERES